MKNYFQVRSAGITVQLCPNNYVMSFLFYILDLLDYPGDSWLTPLSWYEDHVQDILKQTIKIVDSNREGPERYIQLVG